MVSNDYNQCFNSLHMASSKHLNLGPLLDIDPYSLPPPPLSNFSLSDIIALGFLLALFIPL